MSSIAGFPGGYHIASGLPSLVFSQSIETLNESGLLLLVARPKLRSLGLNIPAKPKWMSTDATDAFYDKIGCRLVGGQSASRCARALRAEIISFARCFAGADASTRQSVVCEFENILARNAAAQTGEIEEYDHSRAKEDARNSVF